MIIFLKFVSLFIYNLMLYLIKHQIYFNIGDIQILSIITKLRIVNIILMRCDKNIWRSS